MISSSVQTFISVKPKAIFGISSPLAPRIRDSNDGDKGASAQWTHKHRSESGVMNSPALTAPSYYHRLDQLIRGGQLMPNYPSHLSNLLTVPQ